MKECFIGWGKYSHFYIYIFCCFIFNVFKDISLENSKVLNKKQFIQSIYKYIGFILFGYIFFIKFKKNIRKRSIITQRLLPKKKNNKDNKESNDNKDNNNNKKNKLIYNKNNRNLYLSQNEESSIFLMILIYVIYYEFFKIEKYYGFYVERKA